MATELEFQCPWCGQELVAEATMVGDVVDCPVCGKRVRIDPPSAPDEAPARDTRVNLLCGVLGSLILVVGVFLPIVRIPVAGTINLFRNGEGDGVYILALALISLALTLRRAFRWLCVTALLALLIVGADFLDSMLKIRKAKASMATELEGNQFRGLAEAALQGVEMQWGWGVLLAGVVLLLIAASFTSERVTPPA